MFNVGDKAIIKKVTSEDLEVGLSVGMLVVIITKSSTPYVKVYDWNGGHDLPYEYCIAHEEGYEWDSSCWSIEENALARI